ncbi:hypothetical protein F4820DRAFT_263301 [Hypoxylon rubiginosum]|uniref:Uncharacterized protein n=1 Tax=Hypoxylon rubiginosum TaxID=110542 RepID=A0ACB9Z516_9PEZI|nr:hypothetical protein F4820DRAFT_263301 [Hypoxylon rubiginosum]
MKEIESTCKLTMSCFFFPQRPSQQHFPPSVGLLRSPPNPLDLSLALLFPASPSPLLSFSANDDLGQYSRHTHMPYQLTGCPPEAINDGFLLKRRQGTLPTYTSGGRALLKAAPIRRIGFPDPSPEGEEYREVQAFRSSILPTLPIHWSFRLPAIEEININVTGQQPVACQVSFLTSCLASMYLPGYLDYDVRYSYRSYF